MGRGEVIAPPHMVPPRFDGLSVTGLLVQLTYLGLAAAPVSSSGSL